MPSKKGKAKPRLEDEIKVEYPELHCYMKLSEAIQVETYLCLHENDNMIPARWRWMMNKTLHALDAQLQPLRNERGFYDGRSDR